MRPDRIRRTSCLPPGPHDLLDAVLLNLELQERLTVGVVLLWRELRRMSDSGSVEDEELEK